jgi:phosphoserine phosphatase RsbU/P
MAIDGKRLKLLASQLKQQHEMEHSFKLARKRQLHMLPTPPKLTGLDFCATYMPAANISGDFYDFIRVSKNEIGIALGDVSGHGVEAGIVMGMAKKALQIYARGRSSPRDALSATNLDIAKDLADNTFVSASYGVLDVPQRKFRFARAGNNPPFLINTRRDPMITVMKPAGVVLGIDKKGVRFPQVLQEIEIELQSGDLLFQYTDGLVEAHNKAKQMYGEERLKDLLLGCADLSSEEIVDLVRDSVLKHIDGREQEDDITLIVLKVS